MKLSWKITCAAMLSLTFFLASFPGAQAEKTLKRAGAVHIRWAFSSPPEKAHVKSQSLAVERNTSIENYGYHTFEIEFTIDRDPGNLQEFSFNTQLDIGTPALLSNCYFGIRTDLYGHGRGVSITRCGTHDLSNASTPPGCPEKKAWTVSTPVQGGFTEARYLFDWKKGSYTMRLGLEKEEKGGRWYGLWIIPRAGMPIFCGALKFPCDDEGRKPLIMPEGINSSVAHLNETATAGEIPVFGLFIHGVSADNGAIQGKVGSYYSDFSSRVWHNSTLTRGQETFPVHIQIGGATVHPVKVEE